MNSSVWALLAMIALVLLMRTLAWHSLGLASWLWGGSAQLLGKVRQRDEVKGLGRSLRRRWPKTADLVRARMTAKRFTGLPLTLLIVAAIYCAALFGGLVEELLEAEEMVALDHWLNQQLTPLRTDLMVAVFAWLTDLADSAALVAVALVTTGLLWVHGRLYLVAPLWLTILGSLITTQAGKYVLDRPRPEFVTEVVAITPSFPSGHSTSALAVYGFLAYLIAAGLSSTRQRFEIVYWAAVLVGLVGFSRMLLGVHYASDVAAGFLVGCFWLLLGVALAEHNLRVWRARSEVEAPGSAGD